MPKPDRSKHISKGDLELIRCERQPGNLRITRRACALRYLRSTKTPSGFPKNDFEMAHELGLQICRSCPRGRLYAEELLSQPYHGGRRGHHSQGREACSTADSVKRAGFEARAGIGQ